MSLCVFTFQDVGLALRTLLATVDETLPQLPASTHREVETMTTRILFIKHCIITLSSHIYIGVYLIQFLWFFSSTD